MQMSKCNLTQDLIHNTTKNEGHIHKDDKYPL